MLLWSRREAEGATYVLLAQYRWNFRNTKRLTAFVRLAESLLARADTVSGQR